MLRKLWLFSIATAVTGFAYVSINACMCPGVNPLIYPPDIPASRIYYRKEFKGAAFTGKVLSSREASAILWHGEKVQELTIEADRFWFGAVRRQMTIYTPVDNAGCWVPFRENESYFFIPMVEKDTLYLGVCTYATFNRKADGNYVDFMTAMFGKGKKFKVQRKK